MSDRAIPAGTSLLLKGGRVLMPATDWNEPPRADIAIAGDKIVGIGLDYRIDATRNTEILDARDHLVLPGFVNAHYHSHDVLAKSPSQNLIKHCKAFAA
jgi:guanine deaminase